MMVAIAMLDSLSMTTEAAAPEGAIDFARLTSSLKR
jgi:hypothetical protein